MANQRLVDGSWQYGWTLERRARQRRGIWRWRPWQHSTGPRTDEGKARSARNAYRGGFWKKTANCSRRYGPHCAPRERACLKSATNALKFEEPKQVRIP